MVYNYGITSKVVRVGNHGPLLKKSVSVGK